MPGERALAGTAGSYSPSFPDDWPAPAPRTIQDGLDQLAAGQGLNAASLVWTAEAGAVAGGSVFLEWADLAPVIASLPGQKVVDCKGSGLHMTAGTWPGITDVVFISGGIDTPIGNEIVIDDGCVLTGTHRLELDSVDFVNESTTQVIDASSGVLAIILLNDSEIAQVGVGGSFLKLHGTAALASFCNLSGWGAGTINMPADTPEAFIDLFDGSSFPAGVVVGGAGTLGIGYDLSSLGQLSVSQNPAPVLTYAGTANVVQATGNTGTGTDTLTVETLTEVIQVMTGDMLVQASALFSTSAGATITGQLVRDGSTNVGSPKTITTAAAVAALDLGLTFVDIAPDAAAHSYGLKVTVSAGAITCGANCAQITVTEQP